MAFPVRLSGCAISVRNANLKERSRMRVQLWWFSRVVALVALWSVSASAQSLWKDGARPMVADKRASGVGDIVTIIIQENNTASKDQNTRTSKESGIDAAIETFLYSPDASKLLTHNGKMPALKINAKQNFEGGGKISNAEKITARIAVR